MACERNTANCIKRVRAADNYSARTTDAAFYYSIVLSARSSAMAKNAKSQATYTGNDHERAAVVVRAIDPHFINLVKFRSNATGIIYNRWSDQFAHLLEFRTLEGDNACWMYFGLQLKKKIILQIKLTNCLIICSWCKKNQIRLLN